jgi:small subunit ribosomal protein S17
MRTRKSGFDEKTPQKACTDKNCPYHGQLKVRGKQFSGKVVSDKMQRSVIVEWTGLRYIPKYERYKKVKTRLMAHNPACVNAAEGDDVKLGECRPLSKTKNFVVLSVIGKSEKYAVEKEAMAESKHKVKEEPKTEKKAEEEKK